MDVDTGEIITLGDTDLTITETNITFTTQHLRENRRYNVTVTAFNAAGSAMFLVSISKLHVFARFKVACCHALRRYS